MRPTPPATLEVILILPPLRNYIEGEARETSYRLNCSGEFTRARSGHSEKTDEWPSQGTKLFLILLLAEGLELNFRQEAPG
jgi:hypothetical protein